MLIFLGRAAEARAYAERAVELDPNWAVPHTALAAAKMQSGDPLGALQSMSRGLRRNPRPPAGDLMGIAMINYRVGRTDVAMELWERIRASNSDVISARLQLMALYESLGRDDETHTLVQEILRINPELTAELAVSSGDRRAPVRWPREGGVWRPTPPCGPSIIATAQSGAESCERALPDELSRPLSPPV